MKKLRSFMSYILIMTMVFTSVLPAVAAAAVVPDIENEEEVATDSVAVALGSILAASSNVRVPSDVSWSLNADGIFVETWKDITSITNAEDWYVYIREKGYDKDGNRKSASSQRISLANVRSMCQPAKHGQMVYKDAP